jgi:hypothetical protein
LRLKCSQTLSGLFIHFNSAAEFQLETSMITKSFMKGLVHRLGLFMLASAGNILPG